MTAASDPKLCKSLVPIFNTIISKEERPYLRQASYILYRIDLPRALGTWVRIITGISSIFLPLSIPESWKVKFTLSVWSGKCQVLFPY